MGTHSTEEEKNMSFRAIRKYRIGFAYDNNMLGRGSKANMPLNM